MENISKMEMAKALFEKPYIKVEKKFFGFITNVTYTPTNSPVVGSPNGHWRLSLCYSKDRKFAALCFSEFVGFEYKTIEGPRFIEGEDAAKILQAFVKYCQFSRDG